MAVPEVSRSRSPSLSLPLSPSPSPSPSLAWVMLLCFRGSPARVCIGQLYYSVANSARITWDMVRGSRAIG
eukprot:2555276-Rhodomonas_salina.1